MQGVRLQGVQGVRAARTVQGVQFITTGVQARRAQRFCVGTHFKTPLQ